MFEPEITNDPEKTRSRAIMWVSAGAVLLLVILVVLVIISRPQNTAILPKAVRAGTAEFDGYKNKVQLEIIDRIVHPNMIGMFQLEARARIVNGGDRTLTGVEVVGRMLDLSDKVLAQNVSVPIPKVRSAPLKPGESLLFSVVVDAPGKIREDDVKDIVIELHALQFE